MSERVPKPGMQAYQRAAQLAGRPAARRSYTPYEQGEPEAQFEKFSASELFCPKCQRSMPVREKMLLVLPSGNLYDYTCVKCHTTLGKRQG